MARPFVDTEMQAILDEIRQSPAVDPRDLSLAETRAAFERSHKPWNEPLVPVGPVGDLEIEAGGHRLPLRFYRPPGEGKRPVVVFAHGGGWINGSRDSHDRICREIVLNSGCAVVAVDYRRPPEHPYPAPRDDVARAIAFVADGGIGPAVDHQRLGAAGDSAGAHLVLSALILERRRRPGAVSAAALVYGCYAPAFDTESQKRLGDGGFLLTTEGLRRSWSAFLGGSLEPPDVLATPLDADLAGLPPLYLSAAGLDPLLDDTIELARRLAAAGVPYRFEFFPGVVHAFLRMTSRLGVARSAMRRLGAFFRETLAEPPPA